MLQKNFKKVYNINMKKNEFIKMFKIEEATVQDIKFENNNLIITVKVFVNNFAMGNNIRVDENVECMTTYIFKNAKVIEMNFKLITNIYNSYLVGENLILETNMGMMKVETEEILIEEGRI